MVDRRPAETYIGRSPPASTLVVQDRRREVDNRDRQTDEYHRPVYVHFIDP